VKFHATGSVCDGARPGRPPDLSEQKLNDVSENVLRRALKSVRRLSRKNGVSRTTTHKALTKCLLVPPHTNKYSARTKRKGSRHMCGTLPVVLKRYHS
jgi:hypothetical protein